MELPFDPALLTGYELLSFIDRGAMGSVYRARQKSLNRLVAVKLLDARIDAEATRQRFLQEAQLAARLLHPSIVAVFDAGEVGGFPYIVFELVEGETLASKLGREGRLGIKESLALAKGIAEGLEAAHKAGILHRDLKPGNVLLAGGGAQPKIADFGISKLVSGEGVRTRQDLILGTPLYMSPEQAQGRPLTAASDLYALGICLYEMLSGSPPFTGSVTEVLQAHISVTPPSLAASDAPIPVSVARLVDRALEKSAEARWGSAGELAVALNKVWLLAETAPHRSRPAPPPPTLVSGIARVAEPPTAAVSGAPGARPPSVSRSPTLPTPATAPLAAGAPSPSLDWRRFAAAAMLVGAGLLAGLVLAGRRGPTRPAAVPTASGEPAPGQTGVAVRPPDSAPSGQAATDSERPDAWLPQHSGGPPRQPEADREGRVRGNNDSGLFFYPNESAFSALRSDRIVEFASAEQARKAGYVRRGERRREQWRKMMKKKFKKLRAQAEAGEQEE